MPIPMRTPETTLSPVRARTGLCSVSSPYLPPHLLLLLQTPAERQAGSHGRTPTLRTHSWKIAVVTLVTMVTILRRRAQRSTVWCPVPPFSLQLRPPAPRSLPLCPYPRVRFAPKTPENLAPEMYPRSARHPPQRHPQTDPTSRRRYASSSLVRMICFGMLLYRWAKWATV